MRSSLTKFTVVVSVTSQVFSSVWTAGLRPGLGRVPLETCPEPPETPSYPCGSYCLPTRIQRDEAKKHTSLSRFKRTPRWSLDSGESAASHPFQRPLFFITVGLIYLNNTGVGHSVDTEHKYFHQQPFSEYRACGGIVMDIHGNEGFCIFSFFFPTEGAEGFQVEGSKEGWLLV